MMAFHAGKLVLPHTELGAGRYLAGGKKVNDVARANFGRAEVESEFAAVGKVIVTVTPSMG